MTSDLVVGEQPVPAGAAQQIGRRLLAKTRRVEGVAPQAPDRLVLPVHERVRRALDLF